METQEIPVAVMNYQTLDGWRQTRVSYREHEVLQDGLRKLEATIMQECLEDARTLLAMSGVSGALTAGQLVNLAKFLAERRIPHINRLCDNYIKFKVEEERSGGGCPVDDPDRAEAEMPLRGLGR